MNTELFTKPSVMLQAAKDHGNKAMTGLNAAAIVFLYATFATKNEVQKCEQVDAAQWRMISALTSDLAADDALIRYYFNAPPKHAAPWRDWTTNRTVTPD